MTDHTPDNMDVDWNRLTFSAGLVKSPIPAPTKTYNTKRLNTSSLTYNFSSFHTPKTKQLQKNTLNNNEVPGTSDLVRYKRKSFCP